MQAFTSVGNNSLNPKKSRSTKFSKFLDLSTQFFKVFKCASLIMSEHNEAVTYVSFDLDTDLLYFFHPFTIMYF